MRKDTPPDTPKGEYLFRLIKTVDFPESPNWNCIPRGAVGLAIYGLPRGKPTTGKRILPLLGTWVWANGKGRGGTAVQRIAGLLTTLQTIILSQTLPHEQLICRAAGTAGTVARSFTGVVVMRVVRVAGRHVHFGIVPNSLPKVDWFGVSIFHESKACSIDAGWALPYIHCTMQVSDFDELLSNYRQAVDGWVTAIKAEEALANDDHSMVEMEKWDAAGFTAHDAEARAKKARDQYKNALRKKNYGF